MMPVESSDNQREEKVNAFNQRAPGLRTMPSPERKAKAGKPLAGSFRVSDIITPDDGGQY